MSSTAREAARIVVMLAVCISAHAQATESADQPQAQSSSDLENVPRVPGVSTLFRGFNAGVTYAGVHNSSIGWYTVITPAVSYTFSPRYSADASTSIYFHRMVENPNPATQPTAPLVVDDADAGDTLIGFHATFNPDLFRDAISAYMTAPSGDRSHGLGTGRVTFDFANHMERYYKQTGFLLDLGGGDSSGLVNNLVMKDYSSLGGLVHFQTGAVYWLPGKSYIESVAYEILPIGNQTVYTTLGQPGSPGSKVPAGTNVSEDNGFTTFMNIPWTDHVALSGYYNRSLRQHLDTVSFGATYVLRGTGKSRHLSIVDRALREADSGSVK